MNENAPGTLPDVQAYLKRIGLARAESPTRAFLDELLYAHQVSVPFENLDVYELHRNVSLEVPDLFDKIVARKRGGYCFELNGLFFALLQALGFDTWPCAARVTLRSAVRAEISHRGSIVRFDDGLYYADVGFGGPMPSFALLLQDGFARTERDQSFTVHALDNHWWDICFTGSNGIEKSVLRPCSLPSEEQDFVALSYYLSQDPQSAFRLNRMVNVRTADGARNLRNSTYTEFSGAKRTVMELADDQIPRVITEKFGIANPPVAGEPQALSEPTPASASQAPEER